MRHGHSPTAQPIARYHAALAASPMTHRLDANKWPVDAKLVLACLQLLSPDSEIASPSRQYSLYTGQKRVGSLAPIRHPKHHRSLAPSIAQPNQLHYCLLPHQHSINHAQPVESDQSDHGLRCEGDHYATAAAQHLSDTAHEPIVAAIALNAQVASADDRASDAYTRTPSPLPCDRSDQPPTCLHYRATYVLRVAEHRLLQQCLDNAG